MMKPIKRMKQGQSIVEYALILVLVAVVIILVITTFGSQISNVYSNILASLEGKNVEAAVDIPFLLNDFSERITRYYDENGRWPRSWGDYAYTDIGLDPEDWDEPVEGVYWKPRGMNYGLSNRSGDNIELYVTDLSGDEQHVYNGWSVVCVSSSDRCYIHKVLPENEVDISTLTVKYTE